MKINVEKHNSFWSDQFKNIKAELITEIGSLQPQIEHIGSTAVPGLSAKPIIDILIGFKNSDLLEDIISPLLKLNYVYYPIFNDMMPYRRFFIKHKPGSDQFIISNIINKEEDVPGSTEEHDARLAHIHALTYNSEHWIRHIAFREYLKEHSSVRSEYQKLKEKLSLKDWSDGNDYNRAKNTFIKIEEQKAIEWYKEKMNPLLF